MDVNELSASERTGPPALPAGFRLGTYEIVEPVGHGGMGVVYRAKDRSLDRDVALKILMPALANDPDFEKRFVREARAAAKLDHPGIVQTYSAGRAENLLFIAMQFIRGRTLYEIQKGHGPFEPEEALGIIRQAAEALQAAHSSGLVHRDIKPNNIMMDDNGRVKVMDFGLMRSSGLSKDHITQTGVFYGTPEYASPEQCETQHLDGRSDIYSLGAVLYEMLTGRLPHVAETPLALFKKISEVEPEPARRLNPSIPDRVERILDRMMAKRPDDRYPDCSTLMADIDSVLAGRAPAAAPARRSRPSLALAAIAASVFVAALAAAFLLGGPLLGKGAGSGSVLLGTRPVSLPAMSMVVFDFKNGTAQPEAAWYEIAISDLLITSLSQQEGLSLPTRDQMLWKVKDLSLGDRVTNDNQRRLLDEFRADYYLSGHFYVKASRLKVTLNCYRRADNQLAFDPLSFERPEGEVFDVVDAMAKEIVKRLQEKINSPLTKTSGSSLAPSQVLALAPLRHASYSEARNEKAKELNDKKADAATVAGERPRSAPAPKAAALSSGSGGGKPAQKDALREDRKALEPAAPPGEGRLEEQLAVDAEKAVLRSLSDFDLAKQFYQNRRLVEQSGCDQDEVVMFITNLRDHIVGSREDAVVLEKNLQNFQRSLGQSCEAKRQVGAAWQACKNVDFHCADCGEATQATPGTCWACGAPLSLRLGVKTTVPGNK